MNVGFKTWDFSPLVLGVLRGVVRLVPLSLQTETRTKNFRWHLVFSHQTIQWKDFFLNFCWCKQFIYIFFSTGINPEIRKRSYGETSQFQENFEVYIQALISQCLDANFLDEVFNDAGKWLLAFLLHSWSHLVRIPMTFVDFWSKIRTPSKYN